MSDEVPLIWPRMVAAYGVVLLLALSAAWFPRSRWSRALFARVGPPLDPTGRTRGETFGSAAGYLLISAYAFVTLWVSEPLFRWALGRDPWSDQGFAAVTFISAIAFALGVAGALYLGIRALFRPRWLYRLREDEISRGEYLKTYHHAGEGAAVTIMAHAVGDYEAFAIDPPPERQQLGQVHRGFSWGTLRSIGRWPTLEAAEDEARRATGNIQ